MAVTFVLGRAGSGKTWHCLRAMADALARDDSHRLLLIVPEQASFEMERSLAQVAPDGGAWRAETVSFSRLAERVMSATGATPPTLSARARAMALRRILAENEAAAVAFGPALRTTGFVRSLDRLIRELLSEGITPAALSASAERCDEMTQARASAVAEIFQRYLAWLGPQRLDPAQRLSALRQRIANTDWVRGAEVWVDGFAGFTGEELATLLALARHVRELTITLLMDPTALQPGEDGLFAATSRLYADLGRRFVQAGIEVRPALGYPREEAAPRFRASPGLAELERTFGQAPPEGARALAGVRLLRCKSPREEIREAASAIRRQVIEGGGARRFRDFALITRDLRPTAALVSEVFEEFEIPYFLDQRRPLACHPLRHFVHDLLELVIGDFSTPVALRLLQSGLTLLSQGQSEQLQNFIAERELCGQGRWQAPAWPVGGRYQGEIDRRRREMMTALGPLLRLSARPSAPAAAWARAMYRAMRGMKTSRRIAGWVRAAREAGDWEAAALHTNAWESVCEVLDETAETLADLPLTPREMMEALDEALRDTTLGLAPPTLDQVLVSSIERSRHPEIRSAWLVGFNEGVFPARPTEDNLLNDEQREALRGAGLELRAAGGELFDERLLAYIAVTRPSEELTISFAEADEAGERMFPSPLALDLPLLSPESPDPDAAPSCLSDAARRMLEAPDERRWRDLEGVLAEERGVAPRLHAALAGRRYQNQPECLHRAPLLVSDPTVMGVSGLQKYLNCPFQYFVGQSLGVRESQGPPNLALRRGGWAHDILARVVQRVIDSGKSPREIDDTALLALLDEVRTALWTEISQGGVSPRDELLWELVGVHTRELLIAQLDRWRRGTYRPLRVECSFGEAGALPPLVLTADNGKKIALRGRFDRVDAVEWNGQRRLLIYDYKSTAEALASGVVAGSRLQLLVYLLAGRELLDALEASSVDGVFSAPLFPSPDVLTTKYFAEATPDAQRMHLVRPKAILDQSIAKAIDPAPGSRSPVAPLEKRARQAVPQRELERRLDQARAQVRLALNSLANDAIPIRPLWNKKLACAHCRFKRICRFEPRLNPIRVVHENDEVEE